jgi:Uma2 family endonuclease
MPVSEETYQRVALEDPEGHWELRCGQLRRKPEMTAEHEHIDRRLASFLSRQLDPDAYEAAVNGGRLRRSSGDYYLPDVCVIPVSLVQRFFADPGTFEVFDEPMPLVVEVWSPSTGGYDVDSKLPEYRRRGDREVWRIHPYEQTLIVWRRQPDGAYNETIHRHGLVDVTSLPGVSIDLDELFRLLR